MASETISIIIPCYNLAQYTKKCIDSILHQTYTNLEIITVDDGSTDDTLQILEDYQQKDSRVVVLKQENAGAGQAINRGIEYATGEYITFVDNDDWIEEMMYEKLHQAIVNNQSDMSVCNFNLVYEDHTDYCYSQMRDETVNVYDDVYGYFSRYCACPQPNNYTWTRLYKAEIIKESDVRFENLRLGADTLFNFKLLPRVKRVSFISEGMYNYLQRNTSSVHTAGNKENLAVVYADGFDNLVNYYTKNGCTDFYRVLPIYAYTRLRSVFFYSRLSGLSDDEIVENLIESFSGRKIADYLTGAII